jgi:hypothetical protein
VQRTAAHRLEISMASVTSPSSNSSVQQQDQADRLQLQQGFVALQSGDDDDDAEDADDTDDLRPPPVSPRLSKSPRQESRQATYTNGSSSSNAAAAAAQSSSYYNDERRSLQKATSSMAGINLDDFDYEEEQDRMGTMSDLNLNLGRSSIDLLIDHSRQPSNMTSTMTSMSTLTGASPMSYVFSGSASGGRVSSGGSSRESSPPTTGIASRQRQQQMGGKRGFSPSGKCFVAAI